jgi:hypothetical protein
METRPDYNFEGRTGSFGPPYMRAGETRTLTLGQSNVCTAPSNAVAYVFNVTLVPRGPADFVTIYPAGTTRPTFWSIRSPDGQIVANSAIVKQGTGGAVQVYSSNDTDLLIDIVGYFTDSPAISNLAFYPITPCRVVETRVEYRQPPGPFGPPSFGNRETRRFRLPSSPHCQIPTASAYALTLTAVPPGPLQFLTAWPAGGAQPNISQMNSPGGRVLANSVIIPASGDGSIDVFTFDRSDLVMDITGYFAPDNGQGLLYFPVTQCRIMDTENVTLLGSAFGPPIMESETIRTVPIPASTRCSEVPPTARVYVVNATAIPNGSPMPFLTLWPTGQLRPNASTLTGC